MEHAPYWIESQKGLVSAQFPSASRHTVCINSATYDQLLTVRGIGKAYAKRIVEGRPYQRTNELVTRNLIPHWAYDTIKNRVSVGFE